MGEDDEDFMCDSDEMGSAVAALAFVSIFVTVFVFWISGVK